MLRSRRPLLHDEDADAVRFKKKILVGGDPLGRRRLRGQGHRMIERSLISIGQLELSRPRKGARGRRGAAYIPARMQGHDCT